MDENETRKKSVNAWVFLCLVTKRLANWGELLSGRPLVRFQSGTPHLGCAIRAPQVFSIFAFCARVSAGIYFAKASRVGTMCIACSGFFESECTYAAAHFSQIATVYAGLRFGAAAMRRFWPIAGEIIVLTVSSRPNLNTIRVSGSAFLF